MAEFVDDAGNVHHMLPLDLLQDTVYGDVGASTTDSSTGGGQGLISDCPSLPPFLPPSPPAVHHEGSLARVVLGPDPAVELQDGGGIVRHTVVRPGSEVKLGHVDRALGAARELNEQLYTN